METLTDHIETIAPAKVFSLLEVLSIASSILQVYPSFTSAYLFGSYAKGTAHPESDIDIALFQVSNHNWSDLGGALMDLENAFGKKVDLSMCPHGDFLERIKTYWVPIDIGRTCIKQSNADISVNPTTEKLSDVIKDRLLLMAKTGKALLGYMETVGDVSNLDDRYENAICYCVNILGERIKNVTLGFDPRLQEYWRALRVITGQQDQNVDFTKIWTEMLKETTALLAAIEEKLKAILE